MSCPKLEAMCRDISGDPIAMEMARQHLSCLDPGRSISEMTDMQVLLALEGIPALPIEDLPIVAPATSAVESTLRFDGAQLIWREGGEVKQRWPAVSGRPGFQTAEHQAESSKGPLPEGAWYVRQRDYQRMPQMNLLEELWNEMGRGTWPGHESSWGHHRIWLHPVAGTKTYGRSGFSIHGGAEPGSAGCIDLTNHLSSFIERFRVYGRDMILIVDYGVGR